MPLEELFPYCVLPYKRRFSKFLNHLEQDKGKLGYATEPKKKLQKLPSLHSSRSQTSLQHGPRVFLPWQSQFSSKHRAMAPRGRQKSLKDLNLPLRWIPSSPWWTTHWLSNYAVHSKFPWQGWPGGKSTNTKPDSQGCPGSAFAHFTKKWREKHRSPSRGFWTCSMATKRRVTPSVAHREEERIHRRGKFKSFSDISRPLEDIARCLELNWRFQGRKIFSPCSSEVWERLEWNEGNFEQRSRSEFSHVYFSVLEKPKH